MSSGQDVLQQMFVAGQTRWPRLQLSYEAFRAFCARVLDAKRQLVEQLQASGHPVPAALQDAVGDRRQLGPGS